MTWDATLTTNAAAYADGTLSLTGDKRAAADVTALFEDMATRIVDGGIAFDQCADQPDCHATRRAEAFVAECRQRLAALLGTDEG